MMHQSPVAQRDTGGIQFFQARNTVVTFHQEEIATTCFMEAACGPKSAGERSPQEDRFL